MDLRHTIRGAITAERMRERIHRTGLTPNGHPVWNGFEMGNLTGNHPNYAAIVILNPRRTLIADYGKACRIGITKPRAPDWDHYNEIPRLRRLYPTATRAEILEAFPGRTWAAIANQANARGIYQVKASPRPTGSHLLDQILARAAVLNLSLSDLDVLGRRQGYFSKRRWRYGRPDHRAHAIAVLAMGGHLRARLPANSEQLGDHVR